MPSLNVRVIGKSLIFRISPVLTVFLFAIFFLELAKAQGPALDKLDLCQENINSFKVKYSISITRTAQKEDKVQGEMIFRGNSGYVETFETVSGENKLSKKVIEHFSQDLRLEYNYPRQEVRKIDYKSLPRRGGRHPRFITFSILDCFFPFRFGTLIANSVKLESKEKMKDKEFDVITAVLAKYPLLGKKCRIWQNISDNFIYKFIIYKESEEPVFSLEVREVEINPKIDDAEFKVEIPPDFKEIDITEQFVQQYQILVRLYEISSLNDKLTAANRELENAVKDLENIKRLLSEKEKELAEKEKKIKELETEKGEIATRLTQKEYGKQEIPGIPTLAISKSTVFLVDKEYNFVVIGVGKDEVFQVTDILDVYQHDRLLGKLRIERLYGELAVAEPLELGLIDTIKEGDRVEKSLDIR